MNHLSSAISLPQSFSYLAHPYSQTLDAVCVLEFENEALLNLKLPMVLFSVGQSSIKEDIVKFGRERPLNAQDRLSITLLSSRSRVRDLVRHFEMAAMPFPCNGLIL